MSQLKRGKYGRHVDGFGSGFAGIVATAEYTTNEHKRLFVEREQKRLARMAEYDRRKLNRRGYA